MPQHRWPQGVIHAVGRAGSPFPSLLASVELVDERSIRLDDLAALELEARGEHSVVRGEVVHDQREITDALEAFEDRAVLVDLLLEERRDAWVFQQRLRIAGQRGLLAARPVLHRGNVRDDESDVEGPIVAVDHHVENIGAQLELLFERCRHDVLAVLELVLFFYASCDEQEPLRIDVAHVPGAKAPVFREYCGILLGALKVPLHHVVPVHDNFALRTRRLPVLGGLPLRTHRVDLDTNAGNGQTHAADSAAPGYVRGHHGARLGQAVAFVDNDPERIDELGNFAGQRGTAGERVLEASPEPCANLLKHHFVDQLEER